MTQLTTCRIQKNLGLSKTQIRKTYILNDTYVQQVSNKYGDGTATTVSEAIEKVKDFLHYEEDYETASTEIEYDLIQWDNIGKSYPS